MWTGWAGKGSRVVSQGFNPSDEGTTGVSGTIFVVDTLPGCRQRATVKG